MSYPEHEKLRAVADKSQECGAFIDWLQQEKGISLACYSGHRLLPCMTPLRELLAEFFQIDEKKLEAEKRRMLEQINTEAGR